MHNGTQKNGTKVFHTSKKVPKKTGTTFIVERLKISSHTRSIHQDAYVILLIALHAHMFDGLYRNKKKVCTSHSTVVVVIVGVFKIFFIGEFFHVCVTHTYTHKLLVLSVQENGAQ